MNKKMKRYCKYANNRTAEQKNLSATSDFILDDAYFFRYYLGL